MHGTKRKRVSDFGLQLKEKQKLKMIYGLLERQFRRYYNEATRKRAVTGEALLRILESRLDNTVYRLGMARSRTQARQIVKHGKVVVNGKIVSIPSFRIKKGNVIEFEKELPQVRSDVTIPSFLRFNEKIKRAEVVGKPKKGDLEFGIQEKLIVEHYSR